MTQRNISIGTRRQIRQSENFVDNTPFKRQKLSADTLVLETLFGGLYGHIWEDLLGDKLKSLSADEQHLGIHHDSAIVPTRELTF